MSWVPKMALSVSSTYQLAARFFLLARLWPGLGADLPAFQRLAIEERDEAFFSVFSLSVLAGGGARPEQDGRERPAGGERDGRRMGG